MSTTQIKTHSDAEEKNKFSHSIFGSLPPLPSIPQLPFSLSLFLYIDAGI